MTNNIITLVLSAFIAGLCVKTGEDNWTLSCIFILSIVIIIVTIHSIAYKQTK